MTTSRNRQLGERACPDSDTPYLVYINARSRNPAAAA